MSQFIEKLENGLVVSCYADEAINEYLADPVVMAAIARSCEAGGAVAIRSNLENIKEIKKRVSIPVIGIKKVYLPGDVKEADFRITPTLKEVEQLLESGADAVAIDGTKRMRFDQLTLEEFIKAIKTRWDVPIIADVSTLEEGKMAWEFGADMVGTTLSGYTSYSKHPIKFGVLPLPEPDYEIISELRKSGVCYVISEGRITNGHKMRRALDAGAHCVVIGTSITEPKKIVKTILLEKNEKETL